MKDNKINFSLSIRYDVDLNNDTFTLLYFDHIKKIKGIPKELLTAFQSGFIDTGCICAVSYGGEKNE